MDEKLYDEMQRVETVHWWFVGRRRIVRSLVEAYLPHGDGRRLRVCEMGCGTGGNLESWAADHDVVGVEPSDQAVEIAREKRHLNVVKGALPGPLPLEEHSFDLLLMTDVFEHIEADRQAASQALDLIAPGGILVATAPAYQWLYTQRDRHHHHFRRYSRSRFAELFDLPGVRVEMLSYYNSLLFAPAAVIRLWSNLFHHKEQGDLCVPGQPINQLLTEVFAFERLLLSRLRLPFGLSLVAVVRKTAARQTRIAA